jgi:hypothetical protein
MQSLYDCPECQGCRVVECYACGCEVDCEECDGTGLDPSKIDVAAFTRAANTLGHDSPSRSSWDWVEGGTVKGRRNETRTVAYEDFLLPAEAPPG